ncbi:MAG: hypothetical protein MUC77_10255 [Chromatiaceae bacterium]|jgi:phosphoglycerol transferase|nr:hypothetical protein [Chromatiaceae bacterium]
MMMLKAQRALIVALAAFYGWVLLLVLTPNVSEEYRAYFIERSTKDWRPPRYAASLADGIDFSRPGLPSYLRSMSGVSVHEAWGRWTDARLRKAARFVFERPWSGDVCIALEASSVGPQLGKDVIIRADGNEIRFVAVSDKAQWYRVDLNLDQPSEWIEIEPTAPALPAAWDPGNTDPRSLGLGLYQLLVLPGHCREVSASSGED